MRRSKSKPCSRCPDILVSPRAPGWLTARPVAHRGLHDRAHGIIENTPSSVSAAAARNFAIEVDLQLTSDGEAMVHHDYELGRLTEGSGELRGMSVAQLKATPFRDTADRMMTLGDLCALVAGRVPLVLEVKSRFDGERRLVTRMAQVLASYKGPVAAMSFDPDQVMAIKAAMPDITRGVVAERDYHDAEWKQLPAATVDTMRHLRHGLRTQPHFIAYWVDELPTPAPWIARTLFGCALLTWTVRTPEQRARATRYGRSDDLRGLRSLTFRFSFAASSRVRTCCSLIYRSRFMVLAGIAFCVFSDL